MSSFQIFTVIPLLCLAVSCNKETFRSNGDAAKAAKQDLSFTCAPNQTGATGTREIKGIGGTKVQVRGQFCSLESLSQTPASLVILIDTSGSMQKADPLINGTCLRREAAKGLLEEIATLNVAGVVFDDDARMLTPTLISSADFLADYVNAENFCSARNGWTNYEDALRSATRLLAQVPGKKFTLLLSDGLPTISSDQPGSDYSGRASPASEAGLREARQLRSLADSQLLVNYRSFNGTHPDTESYLSELAGTPGNVKISATGKEFVESVRSFNIPQSIALNEQSGATAVVRTSGSADRTVKVNLTKLSSGNHVWEYVTEEFELLAGLNKLSVTANSNAGSHESVIDLNFVRTR